MLFIYLLNPLKMQMATALKLRRCQQGDRRISETFDVRGIILHLGCDNGCSIWVIFHSIHIVNE